MTSIPSFIKQIPTDARNFVVISSLAYVTTAGAGVSGLNEATNTLSAASWVTATAGTSSIIAGGKLRDMGKTYVSSGRTFRKVQAIVQIPSTFGVGGQSELAAPTADYYTGYIELGYEGFGNPAPVARAP